MNPLVIDLGPVGAELDDEILSGFGPLTRARGPVGAEVDEEMVDGFAAWSWSWSRG